MTVREKWRIYKRLSLVFVLAVVTVTMVQRGNIGTGSLFEVQEQHPESEPESGGPRQKRGLYSLTYSFWKARKPKHEPKQEPKQEPATEAPRVAEEQGAQSWDVTSANCTANLNFSGTDWFVGLEPNFQQFLLYRHCRYFPMLMNHPEKCCGDVYLLIVVKSVITQHDRREVIRRTWGKEQEIDGKRIKTLFLLGTSSNEAERANHQKLLEFEDRIYGDILQWDFTDSFFNLTLKETSFLKWFSTYCGRARYIFKGDDDVFVNVQNIVEYLGDADVRNLFVGDVIFKARPIRRKDNKYYIPLALYNKNFYPPYAGGGGFLMDGSLARKLHGASENLDLYPIDDVFLGMCLEALQVSPVKHDAFRTFGLVKNKKSKLNKEPCFFKSMIVVHKLLPVDLVRMWELVNGDLVCARKTVML